MDREQGLAIRDSLFAELGLAKGALEWGQLLVDDPEIFAAVHNAPIAEGMVLANPGRDVSQVMDKYHANTASAAQRWATNYATPRRDPRQAAVAANGKYKNNMQAALVADRWVKAVGNYDIAGANAIVQADGGASYAAGIAKRKSKIDAVFTRLLPKLGAISQAVQSLPQDNEGQREQRMLQNLRMMRALKGTV